MVFYNQAKDAVEVCVCARVCVCVCVCVCLQIHSDDA